MNTNTISLHTRPMALTAALLVGAAASVVAAAPAAAQAPDTLHACYVKGSGSVYRVGVPDAPVRCTKNAHIPFSWVSGGGGNGGGQGGPPSGAAAGDLGGSYPAPMVLGLQGRAVSGAAPTDGQFLGWNAGQSRWEPKSPPGGGTGATAHNQLTGLAADDHPQYLLADGVRQTVNGFAVTGIPGQGAIPTSGAGTRFMWYPRKGAFRAGTASEDRWNDANVGLNSVAFGEANQASGAWSLAAGKGAFAVGNGSFAVGNGTHASGIWSVAVGDEALSIGSAAFAAGSRTNASGQSSTALGSMSGATGFASLAAGYQSSATGARSVALGNAIASGTSSTAIGSGTRATGAASVALGSATTAGADNSTAIGNNTSASATNATAMGYGTIASGALSMAMGFNGSTNGKMGAFVYADASSATRVTAQIDNHFVVRAARLWFGNNSSATATPGRFIETHTGAYLSSGGAWINSSDVNRKHGFQTVDGEQVLAKVAVLPISTWSYNDDEGSVRHMGPTAQDFHAAFGLGDSDKAIATVDADGVSLAAIQALEKRSREQATEIEQLKRELSALRAALAGVQQQTAMPNGGK